ncbi:MAG: signal recognition particle-docking protein FtsY [Pseudomonadota bacterium]
MAKKFLSGLFGRKEEDPAEARPKDEASPEAGDGGAPGEGPAGGSDLPSEPETPPTKQSETQQPASQQAAPEALGADTPTALAPEPADAGTPASEKKGWFARLSDGLSKSSAKLSGDIAGVFTKRKLDDEALEELEDQLIAADLGVAAAGRVAAALAKEKFDKDVNADEIRAALAEEVARSLTPLEKPLAADPARRPHVILMIGVNGAGKTTTLGKLARKFKDEGKSVMLAAGDTFRAAAIEQLTAWGERTDTPVMARDVGADPAGLAYDAIEAARRDNIDILMVDTAGRLQNKSALMDELAKIVRVMKKLDETAPHDVVLVLDATVGQNAVSQARAFSEIAGVTGLIMTKLDGTARGGVLVAVGDAFSIPIHFVGVGESVEDLQPFNANSFARALAGVGDASKNEA